MRNLSENRGQAGVSEEQIHSRIACAKYQLIYYHPILTYTYIHNVFRTFRVQHAVVAEDVVGGGVLLQVEVLDRSVAYHLGRRQPLALIQRTLRMYVCMYEINLCAYE